MNLVNSQACIDQILAANGFVLSNGIRPSEAWFNARHFLSSLICNGGSIIDVGCGNGFLLKSLQEWVPHELIPYGIDIDEKLLKQAKSFFPSQADHFRLMDIKNIQDIHKSGLPGAYDYVYWNVWDNWLIASPFERQCLTSLRSIVKQNGLLILGFYDKTLGCINDKVANAAACLGAQPKFLQNRSGPEATACFSC